MSKNIEVFILYNNQIVAHLFLFSTPSIGERVNILDQDIGGFVHEVVTNIDSKNGEVFAYVKIRPEPPKQDSPLSEAVKVLSKDMHHTSSRGCTTCKIVSLALNQPFGCYEYQNKMPIDAPVQ